MYMFVDLQTEGAIPLGPAGEVTEGKTHLAIHVGVMKMHLCK
jgi:hypothetical protein